MGLFLFCRVRFGGLGLFFILIRKKSFFPLCHPPGNDTELPTMILQALAFTEGPMNSSLLPSQGQADGSCCKHQRTHPRSVGLWGGGQTSELLLGVKKCFQICAGHLAGCELGACFCVGAALQGSAALDAGASSKVVGETGKAADNGYSLCSRTLL